MMELVMNLVAGLAGFVFTVTGIYSVVTIWSDDLP
jgi:hypothetical protein